MERNTYQSGKPFVFLKFDIIDKVCIESLEELMWSFRSLGPEWGNWEGIDKEASESKRWHRRYGPSGHEAVESEQILMGSGNGKLDGNAAP